MVYFSKYVPITLINYRSGVISNTPQECCYSIMSSTIKFVSHIEKGSLLDKKFNNCTYYLAFVYKKR